MTMSSEILGFAAHLKKRVVDDKADGERLAKLAAEHERQRKAAEEEAKKEAMDDRKLLQQAADLILKLEGMIREKDVEIVSAKDEIKTLKEGRGKEDEPGTRVPDPTESPESLTLEEATLKISTLNQQISSMADACAQSVKSFGNPHYLSKGYKEREKPEVEIVIGPRMTEWLAVDYTRPEAKIANQSPQAAQYVMEIVVRIALTMWCANLCRGWDPNDKEQSNDLDKLYDNIQQIGGQDAAWKWRSLTRSALPDISHPSNWITDHSWNIIHSLHIFTGSEESNRQSDSYRQATSLLDETIRDVQQAIVKNIFPQDLEVFTIGCEDDYDSDLMEDFYRGNQSSNVNGVVAGSSALGLRKITLVKVGERYEKRTEVVIRPKVTLKHTLKHAIEACWPSEPQPKQ